MSIYYHQHDLPPDIQFHNSIAIDTEAMGLKNNRDRLCTIQLSDGNGDAHIVHFVKQDFTCMNVKRILLNDDLLKIFHYARFDVGILQCYLGVDIKNIFCTKIASKLVRTYTDYHGLKILCEELIGVKLSKQERASDWGAEALSSEQLNYAANDVLYLHRLMYVLISRLERENRMHLAQQCFNFIPTRAKLDIMGWEEEILTY